MADSSLTTGAPAVPEAGQIARTAVYRWMMVVVLLVAVATAFFDRINIAVLFTKSGDDSTPEIKPLSTWK